MTAQAPGPRAPAQYAIRVAERLDRHWAARFDNLTLTRGGVGTTTLHGPVADLHGHLTRIRDLGLVSISVQRGEQG